MYSYKSVSFSRALQAVGKDKGKILQKGTYISE